MSIKRYIKDIRNMPLLTAEEEVELGRRIRMGDEDAVQRMIHSNLRLVVKVAHDFKHKLPFDDAVQEGNIGLRRAAELFDPDKGSRFANYAVFWIKQAIGKAIAEKEYTIRVPQSCNARLARIIEAEAAFIEAEGREPTADELSIAAGMRKCDVYRIKLCNVYTVSMQSVSHVGCPIEDLLAEETDDSEAIKEDLLNKLGVALVNLDTTDRLMLDYYFKEGLTLKQIAARCGCSHQKISNDVRAATLKLRAYLK